MIGFLKALSRGAFLPNQSMIPDWPLPFRQTYPDSWTAAK
jgi:hypothetical protein